MKANRWRSTLALGTIVTGHSDFVTGMKWGDGNEESEGRKKSDKSVTGGAILD